MESEPQNPEFRINPENFHPRVYNHSPLSAHWQTAFSETPFKMEFQWWPAGGLMVAS